MVDPPEDELEGLINFTNASVTKDGEVELDFEMELVGSGKVIAEDAIVVDLSEAIEEVDEVELDGDELVFRAGDESDSIHKDELLDKFVDAGIV